MIQESTTKTGNAPVSSADLGVGMRFSLHPHCDDFVPVILGSLADAEELASAGLTIRSDEVSTYVGAAGDTAEEHLMSYLIEVVTSSYKRSGRGHVVAHVLLSRGCPGEASCDLRHASLPRVAPVRLRRAGLDCVAQWSLYPLLDGGSDAGGNHMAHIEAAIGVAVQRGVATQPQHYATKLSGDVADVLATVADAWGGVGADVPHVVSHLTLSVGSPSVRAGETR